MLWISPLFTTACLLKKILAGLCPEKLFLPFFECPEKIFKRPPPPLANFFGRNSAPQKVFAARHHRLLQGNSSRHPLIKRASFATVRDSGYMP
jgi:hypothetical protein